MSAEPEPGNRIRLFSADDAARGGVSASSPALEQPVEPPESRATGPGAGPSSNGIGGPSATIPVHGPPSERSEDRRGEVPPDGASSKPASRRLGRPAAGAGRWRSSSLRSRVLGLAAAGVVFAALVSTVGSVAVSVVASTSNQAAELTDARRLNTVAADALRELEANLPVADSSARSAAEELRRRQGAAVARLESGLRDDAELSEPAQRAADGDGEWLASITGAGDSVGDPALLDEALALRQELDGVLAQRAAEERDELSAIRTWSIVVMVVLVAIAAVTLLMIGSVVARSIVEPMRALGRVMRRFGDGDLRARSVTASDEVGTLARSFNALADGASDRIRHLSADAERGTQLRVISEALDLARDENDVDRILEHALAILVPGLPAELLVNEEASTRLRQVAVNPSTGAPNCPVPDTTGCVAIRRGQTVTFDRPDTLNACPWLRDRAKGPCSAVCIPVNPGGHVLGVLHSTGPVGEPPSSEVVEQLVNLVSQTSTRIGSMRTLETTKLQASTDTLTGLANRRTLELRLGDLLRTNTPFVLAVADLDHFKTINDTYGHEVGDRALQLFATVLAENVRGHDLVARFGGEEFVLVYPEMDLQRSMEVMERIRTALARAIEASGMPAFTCSFGVTHSSLAGDVETIVRIADAGLLAAKEQGRNRVVYADVDLAAEVFGEQAGETGAPSEPARPTPVPSEPAEPPLVIAPVVATVVETAVETVDEPPPEVGVDPRPEPNPVAPVPDDEEPATEEPATEEPATEEPADGGFF